MRLLSAALTLSIGAAVLAVAAVPRSSLAQEAGAAGPADKAMMRGMMTMQKQMTAAPVTGNADKDFVAMMIPHHQGAIDMAEVELRYGKDPMMRQLAHNIIAAQKQEIGEMTRWQAEHPTH